WAARGEAHGKPAPVAIAHDRPTTHAHVQTQFANHALDDRRLLRVFLAKPQDVRAHDLEQFEHDRRDPGEVARAGAALECLVEPGHAHSGRVAVAIEVAYLGAEEQIDAFGAQQRAVTRQRAWVTREVL